MTANKLETPGRYDDLYEFRGDEVTDLRPLFTGDVIDANDDALMMVVQHPCALRRGPELLPRLPAVKIGTQSSRPRSDWSSESPKQMPLPQLISDGFHFADFTDIHVITSADIASCTR
ncbi:hypothetical protein ACFXO5_23780, partial [Bacillus subtilis]